MLDTNDQEFLDELARAVNASFGANVSAVAVSTSETVVIGYGDFRHGVSVYNNGDNAVYLKLGTGISLNLFSYRISKYGFIDIDDYSGPISAITAGGTSTVMVTERL